MSTSCFVNADETAVIERDFQSEFISAPIPYSLWSDVERLYNSVFSSKVMLASNMEDTKSLYAWVEKSSQHISSILLFRKHGCVVQVANEVIRISPEVIQRFSNEILHYFPDIHFIRFHAVILQESIKNALIKSSIFSEDYILQLPQTKEQWMDSLSARAREKLRSYLRRSLNEKHGIQFFTSKQACIDEKDVRAVLKLNQLRMQQKGKKYGMTNDEENQLCVQMKKKGQIFLLKKNNEICAGLLCSVVGTDVYMHVLAHDPAFDKLRLGLVCCIKTIDYVISHKYHRLHFLWGHYDYKKQLGAKPIDLKRVLVIRGLRFGLLHPLIMGLWYVTKMRDLLRELHHQRLVKIKTRLWRS
jgi:hypothetical protein